MRVRQSLNRRVAAPEKPLMPGDFQPENFVFEFEFFLFETADREVVGSWAERLLFNPTLELPMLF